VLQQAAMSKTGSTAIVFDAVDAIIALCNAIDAATVCAEQDWTEFLGLVDFIGPIEKNKK
jgi:hypothetical protein